MTKTASNEHEPQSRGFIRDNLDIMFSDPGSFALTFFMIGASVCGRAYDAIRSGKTVSLKAGTKIKTKIQDHFPLGK